MHRAPQVAHKVAFRAGSRTLPPFLESELVNALEPDRDGLILSAGKRRSLFLPSVRRRLPDGRAFVRHLIAKAGLEMTTGWPVGLEAKRFRVESFGALWRRVEAGDIARAINEAAPALH
jgi:AMMECR1 domain-containing protein